MLHEISEGKNESSNSKNFGGVCLICFLLMIAVPMDCFSCIFNIDVMRN